MYFQVLFSLSICCWIWIPCCDEVPLNDVFCFNFFNEFNEARFLCNNFIPICDGKFRFVYQDRCMVLWSLNLFGTGDNGFCACNKDFIVFYCDLNTCFYSPMTLSEWHFSLSNALPFFILCVWWDLYKHVWYVLILLNKLIQSGSPSCLKHSSFNQ